MFAGSAGGLILALNGGTSASGDQTTTTVTQPLSETAKELLALLEKRDAQTYHARYTSTSADTSLVLETWQDPPRVRQDSQVLVKGQAAETRVLLLPSRSVRCTKLAATGWTCRNDPSGASLDPLAGVRSRLAEGQVTARTTRIDGREVRCFRFIADGQTTELCLDPKRGIPIQVTGGGSRLVLDGLDDQVGDVFEPPADVNA